MKLAPLLFIAFLNILNAANETDPLLDEEAGTKINAAQEVSYEKTYIGAIHKFLFPDAPIFNQNLFSDFITIDESTINLTREIIFLRYLGNVLENSSNICLYTCTGITVFSTFYPETTLYSSFSFVAHVLLRSAAHVVRNEIKNKIKIKTE